MRFGRLLAAPGLAVVLAVAGCGPDSAPAAEVTGNFRPCVSAPTATPTDLLVGTIGTPPPMMPSLTLPCFGGGAVVRMAALGRPAVLNLWASWCGPCRAELPLFQQLADAAGDRVEVLGVVTGDTRSAAAAFAADRTVTFPSVFDGGSLLQRSGTVPTTLPATVFVDAQGRVRHVEAAPIADLSTLEALVRQHLGITV
jgi:thiol-disulfide isomerase/thioredoxin